MPAFTKISRKVTFSERWLLKNRAECLVRFSLLVFSGCLRALCLSRLRQTFILMTEGRSSTKSRKTPLDHPQTDTTYIAFFSSSTMYYSVETGARFSKAPETFRAREAIFSSSVSKNREVHTPEISCVNKTAL